VDSSKVDWNYRRNIKGHVAGFTSIITDIIASKYNDNGVVGYFKMVNIK
jgi:hypothetical protein